MDLRGARLNIITVSSSRFTSERSPLMKPQVAKLLVGVFLTVLLLSATGCAGVPAGQQAAATQAPAKWEYNLGTVIYDAECATKALAPYKDQLASAAKLFGLNSKESLAYVWESLQVDSKGLPAGTISKILTEYMKCGQAMFDAYAGPMGEQGWEMVSYQRFDYTSNILASFGASPVAVDYGYEVMWKRPKAAK
jgi:hypothetical protein